MDPLERILHTESARRNPEDIAMLEIKVEENEFLAKFRNTQKMKDLCRQMKLNNYKMDEVIMTEGEIGDLFFIVYSGEVAIHKGQKTSLIKSKIV